MTSWEATLWAAALGFVSVDYVADRSRRRGLLDQPAGHKSHARATPRSGGLGVAFAALAVFTASAERTPQAVLLAYLVPAVGFLLLGWADDVWRLGARWKALGQVGLAVLAVLLGLRWQGAGGAGFSAITFGDLTPLMTVAWIVAVTTVVNFLDGIDLLTAAWCSVLLGLAAGAGAGPEDGRLYAAFLGALLGFAFWNVSPARTFVGDGGTHLLGFLLATTALHVPATPGWASALPWPSVGGVLLVGVVDVAAGLVTKWRRGIPLAAAHRDHPYQRLTRLRLPHAAVALRYGAIALLAAWAAGPGAERFGPAAMLALGAVVLGLNLIEAARAPRAPASFFVGGEGGGGDHGAAC